MSLVYDEGYSLKLGINFRIFAGVFEVFHGVHFEQLATFTFPLLAGILSVDISVVSSSVGSIYIEWVGNLRQRKTWF